MVFKAAKCPNCGGDLQVPDNKDIVKCMYCGHDIVVREAIKLVIGGDVGNLMKLANAALESTNNEEAYQYYTKVLEVDSNNADAWFGKGSAAGWMSTLANNRISEMITCLDHSIESETNDKKLRELNSLKLIEIVTIAYNKITRDHFVEFAENDDSWTEYLQRSISIIGYFESVINRSASIKDYNTSLSMKWIVDISRQILEGHVYYSYPEDSYGNKTQYKWSLDNAPDLAKTFQDIYNSYSNKLKEVDTTYVPPAIQKPAFKKVGCYIATATMGDYNAPEVVQLRNFRDTWLLEQSWGCSFVKFYYKYGRLVANIIEERNILKKISLIIIIRPLLLIAKILMK